MSEALNFVVTLGRCDDMRAEVFVRPLGDRAVGERLVGTVTGPRRGRDATLPTMARLVPLPDSPAAGPVSRAILTEPAFWTPDLPNLYRVEARLERAAGGGDGEAWIGLRRLGVRGRSFWLDGRRWVPRAIGGDVNPAEARAAAVGLVVESPGEGLLDAADQIGAAVVAVLGGAESTVPHIAALARHPSTMLAIVSAEQADADAIAALRRVKGTLQIGLAVDGREGPPAVAEGIDFVAVLIPGQGMPHEAWRSPPRLPLVAWRRESVGSRAACEALQRDLALWGMARGGDTLPWDWAGYLVGSTTRGDTLQS